MTGPGGGARDDEAGSARGSVRPDTSTKTAPGRAEGRGAVGLGPPALLGGGYRVIKTLGEGGMGVVLLAQDVSLRRRVAVKLLRHAPPVPDALVRRFELEAQAMARIDHPNVVRVHAYGTHDGRPFLVMEYVAGENLSALLGSRGGAPLKASEALAILEPLCDGVSAIHAAGFLHRDLKPSNVLLGPGGRVVVADLGLARSPSSGAERDAPSWSGTPDFMAPELVAGEPVPSERAATADLYSLGVIAYQLLTGELPYPRREPGEIPHGAPRRPSAVRPTLGRAFDEPLLRAIARSPSARTPTAEELRRGLAAAARQRTTPAHAQRMLVLDEDHHSREALCAVLARAFPGAAVVGLDDAAAVLDALRYYPHDIGVIDVPTLLASSSGPRALERCAASDLPLVLLGRAEPPGPLPSTTLLLPRPVEPANLVEGCRLLLERHPRSQPASSGAGSFAVGASSFPVPRPGGPHGSHAR